MVKVIIVTAGLPGAGKGTFADVAREMGIPVLVMGDIIREEVRRRNMELTPENVRTVAQMIREEEGVSAVAKRMVKKLEKMHSCAVLVDGVRSPYEVNVFRNIAKVVVVAIAAPYELRLKRISARGRVDDSASTLEERDRMELSFGVGEVMRASDFLIENIGTLEEFKEKARSVLTRILLEYCPSLVHQNEGFLPP